MSEYFNLGGDNGHEIIPADLRSWSPTNRRVALDVVGPMAGVKVSTVFLGIDHSFGSGPPLLFETMIFGGPNDQYQKRYSTWDEAVAGHAEALEIAKGKQNADQD